MGKSTDRRSRGWRAALVLFAALIAAVAATPAAGDELLELIQHQRCLYRPGGPPGPAGNALVVVAPGPIRILRDGEDIRVGRLSTRCTGPQATIHNVDTIVVRGGPEEGMLIDESGGRFAPGATPEPSGSEIEFRLYAPWVKVHGTEGPDRILLGTSRGRTAIDLDPAADGDEPDYDAIELGRLPRRVVVDGGPGDDVIDARSVQRMGDPAGRHTVDLRGGRGDDVLLGSRRDDTIEDGPGDDLVRAGGGDDAVYYRLGHDTIVGGSGDDDLIYSAYQRFRRSPPPDGSDRVFGGPGQDLLRDENRRRDVLDCGSGLDTVRREPRDRPEGCELSTPQ